MSFLEAIPGIGSALETIRGIVRNFVKDPNDAERLATEIVVAFAGVVKAEIESRFWLAANWRPLVMLLLAAGLAVRAMQGALLEAPADWLLGGILLFGLMGYRMDGKIAEFMRDLVRTGKTSIEEGKKP